MNKSFSKLLDHLVKKARTRMLEVGSGRDLVDKLRIHVELLECIKASMQGDEGSWATSKKLEREWVAQKASHRRALYPTEEELIRDCVRIWNTSSVKKVRTKSIRFLSRRPVQVTLQKAVDIYKEALAGKEGREDRVSSGGYTKFLQFTMFTVSLLNANRKSELSKITYKDLRSAREVYQSEDGGELLPAGGHFNGKVVELQPSSGACKTGKPIAIFLNPFCLRLIDMLRDLASWFFVGDRVTRVGFGTIASKCSTRSFICS